MRCHSFILYLGRKYLLFCLELSVAERCPLYEVSFFHTLFRTKILALLFRVVRRREVAVNGASTVCRRKTGAIA